MTTPLVLDLPDEPAAMGAWLDRQLVGMELGRLVAELEAVHGRRGGESPRGVDDVLGDQFPAVLDSGLGSLSRLSLREVLRQPRSLLEIQERVLVEGGPYWSRLQAEDAELARAVDAGWPGVESIRSIPAPPPPPAPEMQPATTPVVIPDRPPARVPDRPPARVPDRPPRVLLLRFWARSATVVASALLFLYLAEHLDPHPPEPPPLPEDPFAVRAEWGWNRPGVLSGSGQVSKYMTVLAEGVGEWFDERPVSADDFALRLGELRTGCTRLIVAEHRNLPPAERAWLVGQCREWVGKLDDAVHALERGEPVERVNTGVDTTVNRMIDALRERARSLEPEKRDKAGPSAEGKGD